MKAQFASLAFISAMALSGCKSVSSDTKSLDNYTKQDGEDLTINSCGGDYTNALKLSSGYDVGAGHLNAPNSDITNAMKSALTAVPDHMINTFFAPDTLNGSISAVNDYEQHCGDLAEGVIMDISEPRLVAKVRDVTVDWDLRACIKGTTKGIEIILPIQDQEAIDAIKHSAVRVFMYGYNIASRISKLPGQGEGSELNFDVNPSWWQAWRVGLADAFLNLDNQKANPKFEKFSADGQTIRDEDSMRLYAETADSFYCSPQSRDNLVNGFSETYSFFEKTFDRMMKGEEMDLANIPKSEPSAEGLALQNYQYATYQPWQPVRNVGRAAYNFGSGWSQYRQNSYSMGYGGFFPGGRRVVGTGVTFAARAVSAPFVYRANSRRMGYGGFFPGARRSFRWRR